MLRSFTLVYGNFTRLGNKFAKSGFFRLLKILNYAKNCNKILRHNRLFFFVSSTGKFAWLFIFHSIDFHSNRIHANESSLILLDSARYFFLYVSIEACVVYVCGKRDFSLTPIELGRFLRDRFKYPHLVRNVFGEKAKEMLNRIGPRVSKKSPSQSLHHLGKMVEGEKGMKSHGYYKGRRKVQPLSAERIQGDNLRLKVIAFLEKMRLLYKALNSQYVECDIKPLIRDWG